VTDSGAGTARPPGALMDAGGLTLTLGSGGLSWTTEADVVWGVVSYLPGQTVGWDATPSMEEVGVPSTSSPTICPAISTRPASKELSNWSSTAPDGEWADRTSCLV
jgi:hypothetical protein